MRSKELYCIEIIMIRMIIIIIIFIKTVICTG